ncbi:transmembrane protein 40 isoform X2 [Mixophyes fleayi]|uniref:transmembrane protein 40 isoform X2 n=1 Tax=Mixophyes fleayi TaxID=3061075 RepID=UPI003F4D8257
MSSEKFSIPDLTQEEQDIFQKAFATDLEDLKTNAAVSPSFCNLFLTISKSSALSLYTDKEAQTIAQLTDQSRKQASVLKSVDDKGPEAIVAFYLLLHMNDEAAYAELPSCKGNDEKMGVISKLRDKTLHTLQDKMAEMSGINKALLHSHGVAKPLPSVATVRPLIISKKEEAEEDSDNPSAGERSSWEEKDVTEDEKLVAFEDGKIDKHRAKPQRRGWGIQKDDEFFHFIIACFALGAVLVSEYHYSDWTVSLGIGLIAFATLETIGIYFGLINRIRTVIEQFLPLFRKSALGLDKQA